MTERVVHHGARGLVTPEEADALWAVLTADGTVPAVAGPFTHRPSPARAGYVLVGCRVVTAVQVGGDRWRVPEAQVREAAAELNAVRMDRRDLVRVGPFRASQGPAYDEETRMRWRRRVADELAEPAGPGRTAGRPTHLAGIDWRRVLVERDRAGTRTWWLPRTVVRLLDAAEHAETRWLRAEAIGEGDVAGGPAATASSPAARQDVGADGGPAPRFAGTVSPPDPVEQGVSQLSEEATAPPRPYGKELEGRRYSVLSREPGITERVAGWLCAVCLRVPAAVLDHCHEHGYVRAPVCQSCNTRERPDHLYATDARVTDRCLRLFRTDAETWLRHWHRCTGCRARTVLPLPHLAAWTAFIACRSLRPTHRTPGGRKPCGALRVSWTGSQNTPRACLLTVMVDFCPSGEHRILARVPYREAVRLFHDWLAETAPAVAAAAGPDRVDGLPTQPRPVVVDTSGDGLALF
ncbi:endonuclease domain-containing protein [Streptomyces sp. NPDC006999]|uniref:endonuclease domain-containing protein n=1 Tax=Streptomyces sp. NPDC006999 TaxID=3156909 RepID=UPI0033EE9065